eukprot:scaffold26122_cov127-Cylindrotheca_fusiformis.AAC.3
MSPPNSPLESSLSEPLLSPGDDGEDAAAALVHRSPSSSADKEKNVRLILCYTWLVFAGRSIWNQNVLATFCFLLRDGDPKAVGYLTAAMGICQLLVSFPTGVLADRTRRDTLLKVASCVGIVASFATIKVLYFSPNKKRIYSGLVVALCIWGCFWGIANTALTALFADSVPNGQRSKYFTHRSVLINLGNVTGPMVALVMFLLLGNEWTISDCSMVMAAGQLVFLPALLLLCFLKDSDESGDEDDENVMATPILDSSGSASSDHQSSGANNSDDILGDTTSSARPPAAAAHRDETYNAAKLVSMIPCCGSSNQERIIPSMVATADVMAGLASGMSIRYFAIFLYDNLKLQPVHVQILYIIAPLLQASLTKAGQALAKKYGRCLTTVALKWIGITFMLAMVGITKATTSDDRRATAVICTMLVLRTAFMNSTSALTKSVLMDHVPSNERAKWSALESLNMFSWSGSAALGGILVDYRGILFNFCITAALQFVATFPHILLAASVSSVQDEDSVSHIGNEVEEQGAQRTRGDAPEV